MLRIKFQKAQIQIGNSGSSLSVKSLVKNLQNHRFKKILCRKYSGVIPNYNYLEQEPGEKNNEFNLRYHFDTQPKIDTSSLFRTKKPFLFMDSRFTSPSDFAIAAESCFVNCDKLVNLIKATEISNSKTSIIKMFDELSDNLCQFMDAAEVIRQVFPDDDWKLQAETVYSRLLDYMNGLNTNVQIYNKIKELMTDNSTLKDLSGLERRVGDLFVRDFENSGITLSSDKHEKFVTINSEINNLSRLFMGFQPQSSYDFIEDSDPLTIPISELAGLDHTTYEFIMQTCKTFKESGVDMVKLRISEFIAKSILRDCTSENLRKMVYVKFNESNLETVSVIEGILENRYELAKLVGHNSYSELVLKDKMAKSPSNVNSFLNSLSDMEAPGYFNFTDNLLLSSNDKNKDLSAKDTDNFSKLKQWNRDFLISEFQKQSSHVPYINPYFSLGRVMMGISRLLTSLYGTSLELVSDSDEMLWDPLVCKLAVKNESSKVIGYIYCDLFDRYGKSSIGPAHFTVKCSRRLDNDFFPTFSHNNPSVHLNQSDGKAYQLPIVALVCNFKPRVSSSSESNSSRAGTDKLDQPTLLSFYEVETLFHEMGHAMHSMLGQTDYHNVSGTRCSLDYVELPSVLFEMFASDFSTLQLFARNYRTGQSLDQKTLDLQLGLKRSLMPFDTNSQLFMSCLDMGLHGDLGNLNGIGSIDWSTKVLESIYNQSEYFGKPNSNEQNFNDNGSLSTLASSSARKYSGSNSGRFGYVEGTRWHTKFTHLVGYGSSYYSYLFDRVLAKVLFNSVFKPALEGNREQISMKSRNSHSYAAFSSSKLRKSGEDYRNHILSWGGGRDPWVSIAKLLSNPEYGFSHDQVSTLSAGNEDAMRLVGKLRSQL
ncbi:Mitochondrial intermediate peptidase 1 [Smittium culicis]|uniref:mitochondrial intermediate peptidase n=1 Tax=Smittium culicis TaxID=133412 RepID=A0A1R1YRW2_9FUNG|nr:Mitochondrial intermediate peptidase 1 [Smittium culicis]